MIPFEREASLSETEGYVEGLLQGRWDNVVRSTPGIKEDLEGRFPELSEEVSRRIREDTGSEFSSVFRPGVPDFLVFDDTGEYLFVEVKSGDDGLRGSQLKWLRDFRGVNMEIWFADNRSIEKLDEEDFGSYGFSDVGKDSGYRPERIDDSLMVEVPEELAAITGLDEDTEVDWRLKNKDELILDKN